MRRLILLPALFAIALVGIPGTASAASFKSCDNVKTTINGKKYVIATNVKVKGMSCGLVGDFLIAYATGNPTPPGTEDLRTHCKDLGGKQKQAAAKKGRIATACSDGKMKTKAWVLGG